MSYQSEVLADSPLVYIPFDDAVGQTIAADATGNSRVAYLTAGASITAGALQGAGSLAVNGTNSYASIPYGTWMDQRPFTFEAVVYSTSTSTGAWQAVMDRDLSGASSRSFQWSILGNGTMMFMQTSPGPEFAVGLFSSAGAVPINALAHVAFTYSAGTVILYCNGVQIATKSGHTLANSNSPIAIGSSYAGSGSPGAANFIGRIDECAMYPTALSAARILAHYNALIAAPTEARIGGAYEEVLHRNSLPELRVGTAYTEVLTPIPPPTMGVGGAYVEVLTPHIPPTMGLAGAYLEVLYPSRIPDIGSGIYDKSGLVYRVFELTPSGLEERVVNPKVEEV